jgi:hypothetical protein
MKKIYLASCVFLFSSLSTKTMNAEINESQLTYNYFISQVYTDHVFAFQKLFQYKKINSFMEFGLGLGTKYFIDNCDSAISIELAVPSTAKNSKYWYSKTVQMFQHHNNWTSYFHECSPLFDYYEQASKKGISPEKDTQYLQEVDSIIAFALDKQTPDVVFIDQGVHPRVDFVNKLFGKVNVIVAHDTNPSTHFVPFSYYGYDRVIDDPRYVKITYNKGMGTTFWIKKEQTELIQHLQQALKK